MTNDLRFVRLAVLLALTGCFTSADGNSPSGDDVQAGDDTGAVTGDDTGEASDDTGTAVDDTGTGSDDTGAVTVDKDVLTLEDANGLALTESLQLGVMNVAAGTNLTFDWSKITTDIMGRQTPMLDRAYVQLTELHMDSVSDIEAALLDGPMTAEDVGFAYAFNANGQLTTQLDSLYSLLNMVDPKTAMTPDSGLWLLSVEDNFATTYALTVLDPSDGGVSTVDMSAARSTVTASGSFTGRAPAVSAAVPTAIDWGHLTHTAAGADWLDWQVDTVVVAQYHGEPVESVANRIATGDLFPIDSWTAPTYGASSLLDVSLLQGAVPFPGFSASEIWTVTLYCSTCLVAQPMYSAVIQVQ